MRQIMAAVLACLVMGAAAQAQPVITDPDWVRKPTPEEIGAVLPLQAAMKRIEGRAVLTCTVTTTGSLRDCTAEESPARHGFAAAALRLAPGFLMKPPTENGRAVEGKVSIPIKFNMGEVPDELLREAKKVYAVDKADWTASPSLSQFEAAYPAALRGTGASGTALIQCRLKKDGSLRWCELLNETPKGQGFGKAAKSLLPLFRADMAFFGEKPVDQLLISLPFHFVDPQSSDWKNRTIKPVWIQTISPAGVAALFPAQARAAGLKTGRAVVRCTVNGSGALAGCTSKEETPPYMGFGQAAVATAETFEMLRWSQEGTPTEGVAFSMPIRMNLPEEDGAKPATKP